MILEILKLGIGKKKIDSLISLLEHIEYDSDTKTLTIDSDITVKIKGDYKLDVDKHIRINSNYLENDKELNIPYSVFINSDEAEFKNIQQQTNDILFDSGDCNCGNN